ncbi:MAG: hypothetical protein LBU44_09630 [Mediterranea sp.]|jgi:hypothetical protein|nr:hypothetical protein [Mediterranea sp.]
MILELFTYFARYPDKEGVLSIFANGDSRHPEYRALADTVAAFPDESLIPGIKEYVFGQSFETVKARVDKLTGTYLFIDFGEFSSNRDTRNSIRDTQKIAATVAMKITDSADLMEEAIASNITLQLLNQLRAHLIHDAEQGAVPWLSRSENKHEILPFVAKELKSIGWTIMFNTDASDLFDLKPLISSFND